MTEYQELKTLGLTDGAISMLRNTGATHKAIVHSVKAAKVPCLGCGKLITPNRVQCRSCCIDMFGTPYEPR
jgi:hypothetical protein